MKSSAMTKKKPEIHLRLFLAGCSQSLPLRVRTHASRIDWQRSIPPVSRTCMKARLKVTNLA